MYREQFCTDPADVFLEWRLKYPSQKRNPERLVHAPFNKGLMVLWFI